jgi:hypothetical protein
MVTLPDSGLASEASFGKLYGYQQILFPALADEFLLCV